MRADIGACGCAAARCRWLGTSLRPRPSVDVVVASNMLDLAAFRGMVELPGATWVQYLHENQLTYPRQPGESLDTGLRDAVAESGRRRRDLVQQRLPTRRAHRRPRPAARLRPITGMSPNGRRSRPNCASSTPVSTFASGDLDRRARHVRSWCRTSGGTTTRMWVRSSERSGDSSSAGSILTSPSSVITKAAKLPSSIRCSTGLEIGWWRGFLDRPDYESLLDRADVVVSAAKGENFGIAVVEAIAAGAWPVLPDALAYPEIIPVSHHDDCLYAEGDSGSGSPRSSPTVRRGRLRRVGSPRRWRSMRGR